MTFWTSEAVFKKFTVRSLWTKSQISPEKHKRNRQQVT